MVCPQLQLIDDRKLVLDMLETYMQAEFENDKVLNKPSTRSVDARLAKKKAHDANFAEKKSRIEKRMSKLIQKYIKPVVTGLKKRGYLDHDETLRSAIEDMETRRVSNSEHRCRPQLGLIYIPVLESSSL